LDDYENFENEYKIIKKIMHLVDFEYYILKDRIKSKYALSSIVTLAIISLK